MKSARPILAFRNGNQSRQGSILVFAMIALLIVSMLGASLVRTSVASLRQLHREQQQMQTGWLADAGCQRAAFRVHTEPDYKGEDWTIVAEQLPSQSTGIVRITVEPVPQSESGRIITVVAEYPQNATQKSRITRKLSIMRPAPEAK